MTVKDPELLTAQAPFKLMAKALQMISGYSSRNPLSIMGNAYTPSVPRVATERQPLSRDSVKRDRLQCSCCKCHAKILVARSKVYVWLPSSSIYWLQSRRVLVKLNCPRARRGRKMGGRAGRLGRAIFVRRTMIFHLNSVQNGVYTLGKVHIRCTPSLRSFPNVTF